MNERDKELAVESRLLAKHTGGVYTDSLQEFADLIRADEREACAQVCDEYAPNYEEGKNMAVVCATAIRARSET